MCVTCWPAFPPVRLYNREYLRSPACRENAIRLGTQETRCVVECRASSATEIPRGNPARTHSNRLAVFDFVLHLSRKFGRHVNAVRLLGVDSHLPKKLLLCLRL